MEHTHQFVDGAGNYWMQDGLTDDQATAIARRDHLMVERWEGDDITMECVDTLGCFLPLGIGGQPHPFQILHGRDVP